MMLQGLFSALELILRAGLGVVSQSPVRKPLPLTHATSGVLALKGTGFLTFLKVH